MCGLAGIFAEGPSAADDLAEPLARMVATLGHRGPDGSGMHVAGPIGLGHTRLAIIDLVGGAQPLFNEDRSVCVAFNGEILNHRALRAELAPRHAFATASDTEVLVHLYEERGPDFVRELEGFFAFALWDARRARLVLARDRLGKKPLFMARAGARHLFASEPRALLAGLAAFGAPRPEPDAEALADALCLRYVRGRRSGFAGIEKLLPGELAVVERGALQRRRYWQVPEPARAAAPAVDPARAAAAFRERFDAAVRARLEADVPLGLLLSGGIDSTAVLEAMARTAPFRVRTFTVAFSRAADSEAHSARALAAHFKSEHCEFQLSEEELVGHVADVLPHLDEPLCDPSYLPTTLICERARSEVSVCLTGDGGDELFGGYERYARTLARPERGEPSTAWTRAVDAWARGRSPLGRAWKWRRAAERRALAPEDWYASELALEAPLAARLAGPRLAAALARPLEAELAGELGRSAAPLAARMMSHDLAHALPGMILTKVDRASMARSLEVRSPFLDHGLVEWAQALPVEHKLGPEGRKLVVRRALSGRVPAALLERPKKGFGTPLGRWFRRELRPLAEEHLGHSRLAAAGWLDARALRAVLDAHARKRRNLGETLWTLLALEVWFRRWAA